MEALVIHINNKPVTTSRMVADKFNKQHRDVLKKVNNLDCSGTFRKRNFALSSYDQEMPKGGKKKAPEYVITKDGFAFLVMGFTGKEAAKFKEEYINAFNEMEAKLKENAQPQLPAKSDAWLRLIEQQTAIATAQQDRLEQLEYKLDQLDARAYVHVQQDIKRVSAFVDTISDHSHQTVAEYAKSNKVSVDRAAASHIGIKATHMCKELGIEIKKKSHDVFESINAYPRWVLLKIENDYPELFCGF